MTLLPAPAHAAHWVITYARTGKTTLMAGTRPISSSTWGATSGPTFVSDQAIPTARTMEAKGTVTATAVWTHDNGDTDPPPPNVIIYEAGSASWQGTNNGPQSYSITTGTAVDGVPGDTEVKTTANGISQGVCSTVKITYPSYSGGTVTLPTRTIDAQATITNTSPQIAGQFSVSCSYSAAIHAQPYNFHQTNVTDNQNGTLTFTYFWSSTDGQLGDLDPSCLIHEYVTYQGGNPYVPPAPFSVQGAGLPNPTITPSPKRAGSLGYIVDNQLLAGVVQPYTNQSFVGTQTWEFDDSATGQTNQPIPGPDSGPLSITRTVGTRPLYVPYWWYSVTKNGTTAWAALSGQ